MARACTPTELRELLGRLGLTQTGAALLLGVEGRTMRRWLAGSRSIPPPAVRLLWLCDELPGAITLLEAWSREPVLVEG